MSLYRRDDTNYRKIRIRDLLSMTASLAWSESYEGDIEESTVMRMLYLDGQADMARFAAAQPMLAEEPGTRWLYSSGNANILMGILKATYGDRYATAPWDLLFTPLGMPIDKQKKIGAVVERDASGTFVGSTYIHLTPRDMARLGYLYLTDGIWNGRRLLPEGWVAQARRFNAGQKNLRFGSDYVDYIDREGIYSDGAFWLNVKVPGLKVQFPNSPRDTFFAAGHYGQLIVILPTQRLVLARTGHDLEYWSKIDGFVSRAVECFAAQ
jgi:CubicO group peptidase (beta-lactamase class C family)